VVGVQDRLAPDGDGYVVGRIHIQAREPGRCHADDDKRVAIQTDGLAHDIGIAREMPLPKAVTDYRDRSGVAAAVEVVIRREDAAAHGWDPEDAEIIAADPQAFGEMALSALGQVEAGAAKGQSPREGLLVVADLLPDRIGDIGVIGAALGGGKLHKALRIFHWQRTQHYSVEDAENGRVCADAKRQGENCGGGETGIGAQGAQGVTGVLDEGVEEGPDPDRAARFRELGCVAE